MNNSDFELCLEIVKSANDQDQYSQMIIEFDKRYEKLNLRNADLRAQLAEARKDSERLDWVVCSCNDYGFDIGANNTVISRLYWIDGIDEIARGTTPREAIDNAMKGGERCA